MEKNLLPSRAVFHHFSTGNFKASSRLHVSGFILITVAWRHVQAYYDTLFEEKKWQLFLLKTLHWLPVRQRIAFKIILIVYKAMNGQAPSYISELISLKSNALSHNLRIVQMINGSLKCQLLRQRWRWEIVLFLVQHLRFGITFLFRLGNPNQLFHLRLSYLPVCASFSSHISVNYFIVHYLVNDLALSKHGALFKKRSRVYLHSYCAI